VGQDLRCLLECGVLVDGDTTPINPRLRHTA
jgi:hypothetical protein